MTRCVARVQQTGADCGVLHASSDELRAVAFDRGGWDALSPVLTLAAIEGVRVSVHLGGASARHFHAGYASLSLSSPSPSHLLNRERLASQSSCVLCL